MNLFPLLNGDHSYLHTSVISEYQGFNLINDYIDSLYKKQHRTTQLCYVNHKMFAVFSYDGSSESNLTQKELLSDMVPPE